MTEYSTVGITGADGVSTSNQEINHGSFLSKVTINPSLCPGNAACSITDAQIQTELTSQINAGHLPAPQTDGHGHVNTYYAIYFPPSVIISLGNAQSCEQGGFCAYHSSTPGLIPYGVFPDFSTSACSIPGVCGGASTLQIATFVSSHEMAETVTDIGAGVANTFGPPLGWFDGANNQEIADLCDPQGTSVTAGGHSYNVELVFSDLRGICVSAPPVFSMTAPAGGAGPAVPFNMTLRIEDGNGGVLQNYRGTVHFTSGDAGATLPADYTFTTADAGTHTFPFTLSLLGNQTITATDARSSGFTATTTVNVNTIPDMTVTVTHSGNFGTGQTGSYTIIASNLGGGPTLGTVTVVDFLPPGLTLAAMSGTGWGCTAAPGICSRTDPLAAGQSYPPITLTANVTVGPTTVINAVQVSGGGETVTSDDQARDLTTIVAPGLDLAVFFTTNQLLPVSQGDTGDSIAANVSNFGSIGTSGTVTFSVTLPAGFTGVNLSGTGWTCTVATLTCTRSDVLASAQSYPPVIITFSVAVNATPGTSSISTSASGGGTDTSPGNNTSSLQVVTAVALSVVPDTTSQIVTAGGQAQYELSVGVTAAAGIVTFSCSGLPAGASCTFNPASLTNSTVLVTMDVSTTARATLLNGPQPEDRNPWLMLGLLIFAAMAGVGFKLLATPRRTRRLVPALGVCTLLIAGILAGCGGGSGASTKLPTQGTPAGTYTITFTATSSNTNIAPVSQTMTLQVQ